MSDVRPILLLLSGPNLNLLGTRQPEIYGSSTLDDHVVAARSVANDAGCDVEHVQSNDEAVDSGIICDLKFIIQRNIEINTDQCFLIFEIISRKSRHSVVLKKLNRKNSRDTK